MQVKFTESEYNWIAARLARLTKTLSHREAEQRKLIKETAAKFAGSRAASATGEIAVPLARRHLRLLEELQRMSITALNLTVNELNNRAASGAGEPGYYAKQLEAANKMIAEVTSLQSKLAVLL
jgi:L-lactate utilization protein LutB